MPRHKNRSENKDCDKIAKKYGYIKYLKSKKIKTCKLKSHEIESKEVKAETIYVDNVVIDGVNIKDVIELPSQAFDYGFDVLAPDGIFGDRTPVKPPTVNQDVFDAMLLNLKNNVLPKLCLRLNRGRKRLGLPAVPTDPDIVGSISLPIIFRAYPNSTDENKKKYIQFNTSLGWNLEIANSAYPLTTNPNLPLAEFTGSVTGNILTVTEVDFGLIQQGSYLEGLNVHEDIFIIDQLTKTGDEFFKNGTYLLGKVVGDVCNPDDVNLNIASESIKSFLPKGPRIASIFLQYGYVEKESGNVKVVDYDLGNRQFQPTIDFDPNEDALNIESWGEKFSGYRAISTNIPALVFKNMSDPDNTGCLQLVIIRETGIIGFFPDEEGDTRAISTVVNNPSCTSNCTANGTTSTASTSVEIKGV